MNIIPFSSFFESDLNVQNNLFETIDNTKQNSNFKDLLKRKDVLERKWNNNKKITDVQKTDKTKQKIQKEDINENEGNTGEIAKTNYLNQNSIEVNQNLFQTKNNKNFTNSILNDSLNEKEEKLIEFNSINNLNENQIMTMKDNIIDFEDIISENGKSSNYNFSKEIQEKTNVTQHSEFLSEENISLTIKENSLESNAEKINDDVEIENSLNDDNEDGESSNNQNMQEDQIINDAELSINEEYQNKSFEEIELSNLEIKNNQWMSSKVNLSKIVKSAFNHSQQILSQLNLRITEAIQNGEKTFKMQLNPKNLGNISVELIKISDHFKVSFVVESSAIKEFLEDKLSEIKQNLIEKEINTEEFSVNVGNDHNNNGYFQKKSQDIMIQSDTQKTKNHSIEIDYEDIFYRYFSDNSIDIIV